MWDQSLRELFLKGGVVMWPLLACSIVTLAVVIDRAIVFGRAYLRFDRFLDRLRPLVLQRRFAEAQRLCQGSLSPIARLVLCYLDHRDIQDPMRTTILKREGSLALRRLERRGWILVAIVQLSPLLGLLGTVTGLIAAFHQIELKGGQVQTDHLAAGIWEALLTTVFGLMIAIVAALFHHVFEWMTDATAQAMQLMVEYLDEWLGHKTKTDEDTPHQTDERRSQMSISREGTL
jgi:biopolymer transport protein ExbB